MDTLAALLFQMFYQAPAASDNSSTTVMAVSADVPPTVITSSPAVNDSNDGSQGTEVLTTSPPSIVQVQPVTAASIAGATNEGKIPAPPSTCDECLPTSENNSTTVTITSNP